MTDQIYLFNIYSFIIPQGDKTENITTGCSSIKGQPAQINATDTRDQNRMVYKIKLEKNIATYTHKKLFSQP